MPSNTETQEGERSRREQLADPRPWIVLAGVLILYLAPVMHADNAMQLAPYSTATVAWFAGAASVLYTKWVYGQLEPTA